MSSPLSHLFSNSDLSQAIHGLIQRQWEVRFYHVYKEGNIVVDFMTNEGFSISKSFLSYVNPPEKARNLLLNNVIGSLSHE